MLMANRLGEGNKGGLIKLVEAESSGGCNGYRDPLVLTVRIVAGLCDLEPSAFRIKPV